MDWFDGLTDKLSDAASWVSDQAGNTYDSVKKGGSYITGITAKNNFAQAGRIVNGAKSKFHIAIEKLECSKAQCSSEFAALGELRLKIQSNQMRQFVNVVKYINNVEYKDLKLEAFSTNTSLPSVQTIEVSSYQASDLLKDGIQAVSAGALAGVGALGIATTYGVASTGTAIGTLSGAAATNATLAWLGGGSLAAGGLGIAGGTVVLGGIVAVPLLLVFAAGATSKSEKALTEAHSQAAEFDVATGEAELMTTKVACVIARTKEVIETTCELADRFDSLLDLTNNLINDKVDLKNGLAAQADLAKAKYERKFILLRWFDKLFGRVPSFAFADPLDFKNFNEQDKASYLMTVNFGFALYSVLKVKILEDNGDVAKDSEEVVSAGKTLLGEIS